MEQSTENTNVNDRPTHGIAIDRDAAFAVVADAVRITTSSPDSLTQLSDVVLTLQNGTSTPKRSNDA